MLVLTAKIRKDIGKKVKTLRKKGILPAVLYGPKVKTTALEVDKKEFEKVYQEIRENSLISLKIDNKNTLVLIYEVVRDPLTEEPLHIDFYQPKLEEEIEAKVPLVFEGVSLAVKDLGGTLVKNIHELEVKARPQNLPHQIKVNIEKLKTFEDNISIKDLELPKGVKTLRNPEEIIASVSPPEKVEEELVKPIEEKVEEVERVGKEKEEKGGEDRTNV